MRGEVSWTEDGEAHIARHGVTPAEVEEAIYSRPRLVIRGREREDDLQEEDLMDRKTIESLREHYDATDLSAEIDAATAELPDETLTATSIRLPQALLARVRERASAAGLPATTLMRQWIAQCADGPSADAVVSVADLEQLIASRAHTPRSA